MDSDLQSLFGLHVHSCTHLAETPQPPSPRNWAHIRGRYWSAKIDDISLWPPSQAQVNLAKSKEHHDRLFPH